ncbi:MAG: hypothetical protein ACRDYU_04305, partial [Actinomycetes bacterium]
MTAPSTRLAPALPRPYGLLPVYVAGVLAAAALGKVAALGPAFADGLGIALPRLGLLVSLVTVVAAVLGGMVGVLVRRLPPVRTLATGLVTLAAGGALLAASGSFAMAAAARLVEGLGYALVVVAGPAALAAATT